MKVLLVDDEPAMLLAMKMMLAKIEGVDLVGAFRNAKDALICAAQQQIDLAFLDIEIANDDGLELAQQLRAQDAKLSIVFTTSHTEFAMQAYAVYPLDYMVKPISQLRLAQTIARAEAVRSMPAAREAAVVMDGLQINGLGCFEARRKSTGEVKWISRKSKELLAYLTLHRGRSVSKIRILEELFPDTSFKNAETYLYTAVYQLRKALEVHGEKQRIVSAHEKYRADLDGAEIDFIRFEQQVGAFTQMTDDQLVAGMELEGQFAGELFEGIDYGWAVAERERIGLLYEDFAKRLARQLLAQGHYRQTARIAMRLAVRSAYDEEARIMLLHCYGELGDQAALVSCYEAYKQLLQEELGIETSAAIEQMYDKFR